MSIFSLLGLRRGATKSEVKTQYMRKLFQVHPDRSKGSSEEYMRLRGAYERYIRGDGPGENPYAVCSRTTIESIVCRCGGRYTMSDEILGRVECEHCSCFVELEDLPELPAVAHEMS